MNKRNSVFIATSMDGFIADSNGGIDWLNIIPNPENQDMGYMEFSSQIDAMVMGRGTFETVCGFDIEWPYKKPVFVLSGTLGAIPEGLIDKAWLVTGSPREILTQIHEKGYYRLYIDGGITIQNFLAADLIDDITISIIPVLLGSGIPLFAHLPAMMEFELKSSRTFLNNIVQNHYTRKRTK